MAAKKLYMVENVPETRHGNEIKFYIRYLDSNIVHIFFTTISVLSSVSSSVLLIFIL